MFKKVLILSAAVGAGHLRAAEAVEKAFKQSGAAEEIRNIDVLNYTNPLFRRLYGKAYIDMVNTMPEVLGWMYDSLDKPWQNERRRLALDRLNTQPLIKMLKNYQPDIAVCTHFLPAEIISWLKAKGKINFPQAIVVTDFDVHALWLCHHYEQYFVAMTETRIHLEKLGIPADKITVSGIPIDPIFAEVKDKFEMREKYGLEKDKLTILVSAGGFGVGNIEHLLYALSDLKTPAQVLAICGRNEELKAKIEKLSSEKLNNERVIFKLIGFTTAMDEYMSAADLIVGKPGGLTTSEALAKGLIFVVVNPIPGQEERNSDHLLEKGCAIRCNNLPTLAYKIDALVNDETRVKSMKQNVLRFARPNASSEITTKLEAIF
ncbi:MAG: glycosyltransferase [Acidobacteria bacterium]|jgi:processive 1,2-diacylglycerol beta-glucosyltransferase|nr:glycosyltransferase [Acidobacteriota bacterium]